MQNPEPKIKLSYDNQDYEVGMEVYDKNLDILLPDGRVLSVTGWLERNPPQPDGLKELDPFTLERSITAEAKIVNKNVMFVKPEVQVEYDAPPVHNKFNFEKRVDPDVIFSFENQDYKVSMDVYNENLGIQLPDGRVVRPKTWTSDYPPKVVGLYLVENPDYDRTMLAESDAKPTSKLKM